MRNTDAMLGKLVRAPAESRYASDYWTIDHSAGYVWIPSRDDPDANLESLYHTIDEWYRGHSERVDTRRWEMIPLMPLALIEGTNGFYEGCYDAYEG